MASAIESSDSSQAALELLKPDPPLEAEKHEEEEDLEALRMAALMSIKPKKSAYKVQAHPVRSNLLSIVPVEPEQPKPQDHPKPIERPVDRGTSKFDRVRDDRSESESESEYEEIEVEEEVTASESETETEAKVETANGTKVVKKQVSTCDDILSIDCTDEVDEFTNFLNEFEDELKDKPKQKKTKKIMVKKRVKKVSKRSRPRSRSPSPRARGPRPRSRSRSPYRRRSPYSLFPVPFKITQVFQIPSENSNVESGTFGPSGRVRRTQN